MSIRKEDLLNFRVQDGGNTPCTGCVAIQNSPVLIAGKAYCLWCAFRAATELLGAKSEK